MYVCMYVCNNGSSVENGFVPRLLRLFQIYTVKTSLATVYRHVGTYVCICVCVCERMSTYMHKQPISLYSY